VTSEWWWIDEDKCPCFKRDSNPRLERPSDQGLRLRPRCHWASVWAMFCDVSRQPFSAHYIAIDKGLLTELSWLLRSWFEWAPANRFCSQVVYLQSVEHVVSICRVCDNGRVDGGTDNTLMLTHAKCLSLTFIICYCCFTMNELIMFLSNSLCSLKAAWTLCAKYRLNLCANFISVF
jgi:hypothetical protein